MDDAPDRKLRRGWTTGACATAATRAAMQALVTGRFPDPVAITLPRGETPSFALAFEGVGPGWARAGVVKDAGDDPDVTHGALVLSTVRQAAPGVGLAFRAGEGVGTVTKPGLPTPPGEPAINPAPRRMMEAAVQAVCRAHGVAPDVEIEIAIPGGAALAAKTWNPRLGIVGGLSILGTTGIVHPYSCSAWIHAIHRGIDVARADGLEHVGAATGATSEAALRRLHAFPAHAILDMGDFAGGVLKYLRDHPVPRLSLAGGFAKLSKLAQGALDLHSGRSQVDFDWFASAIPALGGAPDLAAAVRSANMAAQVLEMAQSAGLDGFTDHVAKEARRTARRVLGDAPVAVEILIVDRTGMVVGRAACDAF